MKQRLHELKDRAFSEAWSLTETPLSSEAADKVAQCACEPADLRERLEGYIAAIGHLRQIFTWWYVHQLSWQKIQVGAYDESVPRKRHNRFLPKKKEESE